MGDGQSGSTDILRAYIPAVPEYLTYVVLVYRLVCAVIMFGLGGMIVSTIVKIRALHNVHSILIVNLMVSIQIDCYYISNYVSLCVCKMLLDMANVVI